MRKKKKVGRSVARLTTLDEFLKQEGKLEEFEAVAIKEVLAGQAASVPEVGVLNLVDARGMQRYRSRDTGQPLAYVSDRPYFQAQRDRRDTGLFINQPIVTRSEGLPSLVLSRRVEQPDGTPRGGDEA